jgi:hypothetical protein
MAVAVRALVPAVVAVADLGAGLVGQAAQAAAVPVAGLRSLGL